MGATEPAFALRLLGAFRLDAPGAQRVDISSKRGQALIAMLATAGGGERTRSWLQDRLWGSRGNDQAQASLRRELSNLKKAVNRPGAELLKADYNRVWIDLALVQVDLRELDRPPGSELLEGLDIAGEDGFEDWLREERGRIASRAVSAVPAASAPQSPAAHANNFALRPAIAVLPFVCSPADPDREAMAEGLSEDLTDRLAKLRWLPVIARSSSFSLQAERLSAPEAGARLGARYVVEGTLRGTGEAARLAASLIDAESGQVLWSAKLPLDPSLDPLISGITAALGLTIDQAEQQRALRKPQSDLNVNELIWRGRWHLNRLTTRDALIARDCFAEALEREPSSPEAIIQLTMARLNELWTQRGSEDDIRRLRQLAQRSIIADPDDARGHMLAGIAEIWLRQPLRAEALLGRALELNPSLFLAHTEMGSVLYLRGEPEAALAALETAHRLSPNDHTLFYMYGEMGMAHLMLGQFDRAEECADAAIMLRQAYWYGHAIKVNALGRSGNPAGAARALAELRANVPQFDPGFTDWLPFIDSHWNRFLRDGLNL